MLERKKLDQATTSQRKISYVWRVPAGGGEAEPHVLGRWHLSFSPDHSMLADNDHKAILVTPIDSGEQVQIFEFEDPSISIDYTVWSPEGRGILFDRLKQQGGDIWVMENFE